MTSDGITHFWHPFSVLPIGTHAPGHCGDAEDDEAHDGGVLFPVGGLGVPASSWGPDMFGVTGRKSRASAANMALWWEDTYGIFGPALRRICVGLMAGVNCETASSSCPARGGPRGASRARC